MWPSVKRFFLYEKDNFSVAKNRLDLVMYVLWLTPLVVAWVLSNVSAHSSGILVRAGLAIFAIWFFVLLPFRRHEQQEKTHADAIAAKDQLLQKKQLTETEKLTLARFLEEGRQLQKKVGSSYSVTDELRAEVVAWDQKVTNVCFVIGGEVAVATYRNDSGIPDPPTSQLPARYDTLVLEIYRRRCRLGELINSLG